MQRKVTNEDRRLAIEGLKRRQNGQTPSDAQSRAIKRVEREKDDEHRWEIYKSIPKRHYEEMSCRQRKVINEQAARYRLPIQGEVVDICAVVFRLHELLAENKHALAGADIGQPLDRKEAAEIGKIETDLEIKRLKLEEMRGRLVDLETILNGVRLVLTMVRTRLQAIPGEMAPLIPAEIRDDLVLTAEDKIRMILIEMSAWENSVQLHGQLRSVGRGGKVSRKRQPVSRRVKSRMA